jgi:hypothetical protein
MKRLPRKRRTREHVLADLSANHVELQALRCGYAVERIIHDYGIDLELFTFTRKGEFEEGVILLQLKATARLRLRPGQAALTFRIERADLVSWLAQPMPVILVVYDGRRSVAYWLYVQRHFQQREGFNLFAAGKTITVRIPKDNVLDPSAVRWFAKFRDRLLEQMTEVRHDKDEADSLR